MREPGLARAGLGGLLFLTLTCVAMGDEQGGDHRYLSSDQVNDHWHAPAESAEAVFVPPGDPVEPALMLRRGPIVEGALTLTIATDAGSVVLGEGEDAVEVELGGRRAHRLVLDARHTRPTLELDGEELAPLRGRWIRLMLHGEAEAALPVRFVEAEYANVEFHGRQRPRVSPAYGQGTGGGAALPGTTRPEADSPRQAAPGAAGPDVGGAGAAAAGVAAGAAAAGAGGAAGEADDAPEAGGAGEGMESAEPRDADADAADAEPAEADAEADAEAADLPPSIRHVDQDEGTVTERLDTEPRPRRPIPPPEEYVNDDILETTHPWRFSFTAGVDYLTAYFYRGIARENQDLILQPWADTSLRVFTGTERELQWLDYVDTRIGLRSTHIWHDNSIMKIESGERWQELDWYGGVAVGFLERWEAGLYYNNVESITTSFRDVHQVNFELHFDDSDAAYDWSFQPYALVSAEYEHQSDWGWFSRDTSRSPETSRGIYLELGMRPEFDLFELHLADPVKLGVPVAVGLSLNDYYEDTTGRDSTFGYLDVGLNFDVPVASFPAEGDRRFLLNLHAGVHFLYLGSSTKDLSRAFGAGGRSFQPIGRFGMSLSY